MKEARSMCWEVGSQRSSQMNFIVSTKLNTYKKYRGCSKTSNSERQKKDRSSCCALMPRAVGLPVSYWPDGHPCLLKLLYFILINTYSLKLIQTLGNFIRWTRSLYLYNNIIINVRPTRLTLWQRHTFISILIMDIKGVRNFSGTDESVDDWLFHFSLLAQSQDWSDESKLKRAPVFLAGPALEWYRGQTLICARLPRGSLLKTPSPNIFSLLTLRKHYGRNCCTLSSQLKKGPANTRYALTIY